MYNFTGMLIWETGSAGSDLFSVFEIEVAEVFGEAQDIKTIIGRVTNNSCKTLIVGKRLISDFG